MTQRSQPPAGRPRARRDSTRPPRTRRGTDRAPYPGAPAPAARSNGGTGSVTCSRRTTATRTRTRAASPAPTPATVWACGPDPINPGAAWPTPIVETTVAAFTRPGARVLLLPWPTPSDNLATPVPAAPGGPAPSPLEDELASAREAVRALGRPCEIVRLAPGSGSVRVSSRPFWADLVTDRPAPAPGVPAHPAGPPDAHPGTADTATAGSAGRAGLIITALPAHHGSDGSLDRVALAAARLLTVGGILAVYTHSDWYQGQLVDPTGPMVAAGQNADLLYLQHIVTLHTPIRHGRLQPLATPGATAGHARARRRAAVRGLPAPHARAHSDLLVFAQAHDHQPPPPVPGTGHATTDPATPADIR